MKELTTEQKAQRYDEALGKAMIYYKEGNEDMKMMMKTCFPVLVEENEDERIRKWCISHFKECINVIKDNDEYKEYLSNKVLAWLEKQSKDSPVLSNSSNIGKVEPKFKVGQTIIYKGTENIAPTKMTISDIANGQYWDDNCCIVPISDQDEWELVEQKAAWNEEDEKKKIFYQVFYTNGALKHLALIQ